MRGGATPAFIFATNPFATGEKSTNPVEWTPSVTLEIGRRTDGSRIWHKLYGMPAYGVGFSVPSVSSSTPVHPYEAYGFFSWPFATLNQRMDLTTDFSLGASWNWQPVLKSNLNARIDLGLYVRTTLSSRTVLYTGIDVTHRSNGGLEQPNLGINEFGPKVMMQYNFSAFGDDVPKTHDVHPPGGFHPEWSFVVAAAGGAKNVIETTTPSVRQDFGTVDVSTGVQRQFYRFGRVVGGVDVIYDGSTGSGYNSANPLWRADVGARWALGLYGGYEHIIGRFGAGIEVGERVMRMFDDSAAPRIYERYSWSYAFSERMFTKLAIRATGDNKADAFELGVGYRWSKRHG